MKPQTAFIIFLSIILPSIFLGYHNYMVAQENIIEDVNQALATTILKRSSDRITADTLNLYRQELKINQLENTSYLSLCTEEPSKITFCSDTMSYKVGEERFYIRAYPNCSKAAILGMSDQKVPSVLFTISLFWGMFSMIYFYRKNKMTISANPDIPVIKVGSLSFYQDSNIFLDNQRQEIYFTPMQLQLMKMFVESKNHKLSVEEICNTLWPGKEDARDTLYTLIRRLKPIVEKTSNMRIMAEKGHYYVLKIKSS